MTDIRKKLLLVGSLVTTFVAQTGNVQAAVMTFDNATIPKLSLPYIENGLSLNLIPLTDQDVSDPENKSHIHTEPGSNGGKLIKFGEHLRGGVFQRTDGQPFSLIKWDVEEAQLGYFNAQGQLSQNTLKIVGYKNGTENAEFTLTNNQTGEIVFPDFQNVDKVEFWFTDPGRGIYPLSVHSGYKGLAVKIDNVTFDAPKAVPLPAAAWLFGSALLGGGIMRRKPGTTVNS